MNLTKFLTIVIGLLVGLSAWLYWPTEERAVRRRLVTMAEILSVPAAEADLARVTRAAELRKYLAPDVRIGRDGQQAGSRDAVLAAVSRFSAPPGGFTVEIVDMNVNLADDRRTATVDLEIRTTSRTSRDGEPAIDERDATIGLAKLDGTWIVTSAEPADAPPALQPRR